jgi:DNA-binding NarL/FixJ family response regulator
MRWLDRRPTVVLADDHPRVLSRVGELLANECDVVAGVSDGIKAVQAALKYKPDIVVLDIAMPGLDGIQAGRELRRLTLPMPARLIFLTVQEDADYIRAAHELGASYVVKRRMHIDLLLAVKEALAGRMFVSPRVLTHSGAI